MSYRLINVRRYKRGASWDNGEPRLCTRCGVNKTRKKRAVVVADLKYGGTKFAIPVAYCENHIPDEIAPTTPS